MIHSLIPAFVVGVMLLLLLLQMMNDDDGPPEGDF